MSFNDINIKNQTYHFFSDTINIKEYDQNNIGIDEKFHKNML